MIANIDLLNEIKDGGLTMDDELVRLKEMGGGDCEGLINLAAMPTGLFPSSIFLKFLRTRRPVVNLS